MKHVTYINELGRKIIYELPNDALEEDAEMGILVGPPENIVEALGYPEPFATRLHNLLAERKVYTAEDISKNPGILKGVLQAALGVDIQILQAAFLQEKNLASDNGKQQE